MTCFPDLGVKQDTVMAKIVEHSAFSNWFLLDQPIPFDDKRSEAIYSKAPEQPSNI